MGSRRSIADDVIDLLVSKGVDHVFGITGAGNLSLFEALRKRPEIEVVFTHHEQAAVMAANAFTRVSGTLAVAIVTTGAGASNAITGAISANMDSIPVLIIAGTEPSRFIEAHQGLRGYGLQGYDTVKVIEPVVKYAKRITKPSEALGIVTQGIDRALAGRQGVSWIEFPLDLQSLESVDLEVLEFESEKDFTTDLQIDSILENLRNSEKPLFWFGAGIRSGGAIEEAKELIEKVQIPFLLSWSGLDMISHAHPFFVGKAGLYGERASNLILQNCDYLLVVGARLSIPQVGYSQNEFAPNARVDVVDIDSQELDKLAGKATCLVKANSKVFLKALNNAITEPLGSKISPWISHIKAVQDKYPKVSSAQINTKAIHSNHFVSELSNYLREEEVVVTDAGTSLISTNFAMSINGKQRVLTSLGLGEMGFGLPGAIGAAFAVPDRRIVCLNSDGGLMMNLQEFQTAIHHNLKLKIFIFNNDGYLSIKNSQANLFDSNFIGVDASSGISFPSYKRVAAAFNISYQSISRMSDFSQIVEPFMKSDEIGICEIFMDPLQPFEPRVSTTKNSNGELVSPTLEDMVPLIPLADLEWAIQRTANEKSYKMRNL